MKKVARRAARAALAGVSLLAWTGVAATAVVAVTIGVAVVFGCPFGAFELALWWGVVLPMLAACIAGHIRTEDWLGRWSK